MLSDPITGAPCDTEHPYPAPHEGVWIDSMEYGDTRRVRRHMHDRDITPAWRAVAANLWGRSCYEQHLHEVADDPILTTYVIASAVLSSDPNQTDMITRLGFAQAGAAQVFEALHVGGLEGARRVVDGMPVSQRVTALQECVAHINHGSTALRLDAGARFHS